MPSLALLTGRALWEPVPHPSCHSLKLHPWVTRHGAEPLPSEDENCTLVEVTEEEVENSVKHIPSLATVVRREDPLTEQELREPEARLERAGLDTHHLPGKQAAVGPENPVGDILTHSRSLGQ